MKICIIWNNAKNTIEFAGAVERNQKQPLVGDPDCDFTVISLELADFFRDGFQSRGYAETELTKIDKAVKEAKDQMNDQA